MMKFGCPICYYCGRDVGFYAEVREHRETKTGKRLLGWYVCCTRCNADNYVSVEMAIPITNIPTIEEVKEELRTAILPDERFMQKHCTY